MATVGSLIIGVVARTAKFEAAMRRVSRTLDRSGRRMQTIGANLTRGLTLPLAALGGVALKSAIDFESAFAGVIKTVDATESQLAELRSGIRAMSRELPASAVEIAGVAEAAGQLGIETENILSFTRTMVDLGETTNMSAQEAATALARLANITGMAETDFDRLGSVIVELGNNLATTEAEIVEMGLRIAGAGKTIGLTEAQVLGFAGALSSVGIQAQAGGTAISRTMIGIAEAVEEGGRKLDMFARVAGMSAGEFRQKFQTDAAGAITDFVEGLGKITTAGDSVFPVLDELGLSEVRVRDALLRASGAGDLFRKSIALGSEAWKENTALAEEARKRYETVAARLSVLKNRFIDAAVSLGEALMPAFERLMGFVDAFLPTVEGLIARFVALQPSTQNLIIAIAGLAAAAGPLIFALGAITIAAGALSLPFTAAAVAIGAAGVFIISRWDRLKESLQTIFIAIQGTITSFVDKAKEKLALVSGATEPIKNAFGRLRDFVVRAAETIGVNVDTFGDGLSRAVPKVQAATASLTGAAKAYKDSFIEGLGEMRINADEWLSSLSVNSETSAAKFQELASRVREMAASINTNLDTAKVKIFDWGSIFKSTNEEVKSSFRSMAVSVSGTIGELTASLAKGEISFKRFAEAAVRAITKVLFQLAFLKAFGPAGGAFAGGFFGGFMQRGGRTQPGEGYIVGEAGPEFFAPDTAGRVTPLPELAAAGAMGGVFNVNNYNTVKGLDFGERRTALKILRALAEEMKKKTAIAITTARRFKDVNDENARRAV